MEKHSQNDQTKTYCVDNKKRRAILLPIHPNYLLDIMRGIKTIEIRNTCPKEWLEYFHNNGELPEEIDVFLYCTKRKPEMAINGIPANGRVVAKFTLRRIWSYINGCKWENNKPGKHNDYLLDCICHKARIDEDFLWKYSPDLAFYAWHIEDVEVLERPLELSHFNVSRAPQTWRYVYA